MESVIMTTGDNNTRLRSRLRSAASAVCARTQRRRRGAASVVQRARGKKTRPDDDPPTRVVVTTGHLSREVYEAWCSRIGPTTDKAPLDILQPLFNDIQLYPSAQQVNEMVSFIRQATLHPSHYLTFGELCLLTSELRRLHSRSPEGDVFLGGSCGDTTWRADSAIPTLSSYGISYYNPQVEAWHPELIEAEQRAKEHARVLLFVVDGETRCAAGMLEMAQLAAQRADRLVAVIRKFEPGRKVAGETVPTQEAIELSEARRQLLSLLHNRGIRAHTELDTALRECAKLLARQPTITLRRLRNEYDKLSPDGGLSLPDTCAACYRLTGKLLTVSELRAVLRASGRDSPRDVRLTYDQLCTLVAELGAQPQAMRDSSAQNGYASEEKQETIQNELTKNSVPSKTYDIFLGNSVSKTVEPLLRSHNITWTSSSEEVTSCRSFIFHIPETKRGAPEMVLAAHYVALYNQNCVLCIKDMPETSSGMSSQATRDYNRARAYLRDLATRERSTICTDLEQAVRAAMDIAKQLR